MWQQSGRILLLPRGVSKRFPCPTCGKPKTKKALTCMPCYRRGYGKKKDKGHDLKSDKEAICRLKERILELERERRESIIKTKNQIDVS